MAVRKSVSLITINLLKSTNFEYTTLGKSIHWMMTFGKYIVFLAFLIVIGGFVYRFSLDQKIEFLNETIENNIEHIQEFSQVEADMRKFQDKLTSIKEIVESVRFESNTLTTLEASLPPKTQLDKISITDDALNISGTVANEIVLVNLVAGLRQQEAFEEIAITNLQSGGIANPSIIFEMKLSINSEML